MQALISSLLALVLCFTMLVGTTFAWFTDSVSSDTNKIIAGNLDVELEYYKGGWNKVENSSEICGAALWEPGHTEVIYLKITNKGNLALKYSLAVNILADNAGISRDGQPIRLSQLIEFDVIEGKQPVCNAGEL